MTTLCFLDTETTSLLDDRRPWEIGAIVRRPTEPDSVHQWFIHVADLNLASADPVALDIGGFWDRHPQAKYVRDGGDPRSAPPAPGVFNLPHALRELAPLVADKAVILGSNPAFDTSTLAPPMVQLGITPGWHYHPVDVPTLAQGWLAGMGKPLPVPSKSDVISLAAGVDPAGYDRHSALGDCYWLRDLFDVVMLQGGGHRIALERLTQAADQFTLGRSGEPLTGAALESARRDLIEAIDEAWTVLRPTATDAVIR